MASPPLWVILGNVAWVSGTDANADNHPPGANLALALAASLVEPRCERGQTGGNTTGLQDM
jgi:hypothetical protein